MLIDRMIRAARLDLSLYNEVERDLSATSQALTVVVIVALAQGVGSVLGSFLTGNLGAALSNMIWGTLGAIVGWVIWSFVTYFVGTTIFGGNATPGQLLRCLGFAATPNILGFFVFIPCLGWLPAVIGGLWSLVAGVIAVREALDFDTSKAILTAVIGWVLMWALFAILGVFNLGLGALRPGF